MLYNTLDHNDCHSAITACVCSCILGCLYLRSRYGLYRGRHVTHERSTEQVCKGWHQSLGSGRRHGSNLDLPPNAMLEHPGVFESLTVLVQYHRWIYSLYTR